MNKATQHRNASQRDDASKKAGFVAGGRVSADSPDGRGGGGQPRDERQEQIAREAYAIWERSGRLTGDAAEHWYAAEKKLFGQGNPAYPSLEEREAIVKDQLKQP